MGYSLSELQEVLEKFGGIEYEQKPANFFEVINGNKSHHEKYVSNTLAFFLDSSESHGLGTLVLDALLEAANVQNNVVVEGDYYVEREKSVDCGGRGKGYIDIYVSDSNNCTDGGKEAGGWAIAIENKVWAPVYNPLKCYCAQARKCVGKDNNPVCILLTLAKKNTDGLGNFRNVTYEELAERVKSKLNLFDHTPSKYTYLLVEFFEHLGTLKRGGRMDRALIKFLQDHKEQVFKLTDAVDHARKDVQSKAKQVRSRIEEYVKAFFGDGVREGADQYPREVGGFTIANMPQMWTGAWRTGLAQVAFVDLKNGDCVIAFDTYIYLNGDWKLYVFARNKPPGECNRLFERILPGKLISKGVGEDIDNEKKYLALSHKADDGAEMDAEEIAEKVWCKIRALVTGEERSSPA